MTWVFVRLKARLVVNGVQRLVRSKWAAVGFVLSVVFALGAAALGFAFGWGLRSYWDPGARHRLVILATSAVVVGWWFAPLISGGVDETVDPARLSLLPLTRSQIRRGQIAAGFVGIAPTVMVVWVLGLVVGMYRGLSTLPLLVLNGVVVLLMAIVGSRMISTSFARMSRTRRGGDAAALMAVVGGSAVFAGMQLIRFVTSEQLDAAARVMRWTPPGAAGEAFEAASEGRAVDALVRIGVAAALTVVAGWWWSRQLNLLLTEPTDQRGADVRQHDSGTLAIFSGLRRFLPQTPSGAAVARELIYLARSPGRRASLLAGTVLGLVYVGFFVFEGDNLSSTLVMAAPISMLFALQYASNQLGVDPAAFWLEVSAGPDPVARWAGRQLLGLVSIMFPVTVSAVILATLTGGWVEFCCVMLTMIPGALSMVGVGSFLSPLFVTPLPDTGNPFGTRQSMSGTGCAAGIVGLLYLVLIVILVVPAEFAIRWAWTSQHPLVTVGVVALVSAINLGVWWASTRYAVRDLPRKELEVLGRLDQRLNV